MGTENLAIPVNGTIDRIKVDVDSNWGARKETRRSVMAGVILVGGCPMFTWSRTQTCVAQSSGESEFYGIVEGVNEGLGFQNIMKGLGMNLSVEVRTDSSAGKAASTRLGMGKMRHIDIRHLHVQDVVAKGLVSISKIGGTDNIADIGTKAVSREVLVRLRPQVGIVEMGSVRSQVDALAATCSGTADGAAHLSYQRLPEAAAAIGANWNTILAGLVLMQQAFQARGDAATSAAEATSMQHVSVLVQSSKIEWWLITFLLLAVTWMLLKPSPSSGNCWRHLFGFVAPSSCNQSILKIDVGVQTLPLEEKTAVVVEEKLVEIEKIVNVEVLPPIMWYTEVGDCAHTDEKCRTIMNSRKKKPLRPCKACTRRGGGVKHA